MKISTVGSLCSGIEASAVAWKDFNLDFKWFSEIDSFPSSVLKHWYPNVPNLGDMKEIPTLLKNNSIPSPDLICGGTPCQAFSYAGYKQGLDDDRGNLTLKFVDVLNENDKIREKKGLPKTLALWENVEGVLSDKTNAFGLFLSALAGLDSPLSQSKWPSSGLIYGVDRNIAWRVLDAKFFGIPQQRKRLYVIATDKKYHPENILFEQNDSSIVDYPEQNLRFTKNSNQYEVFREYTDCLYASYGTKWNGNAAATNGSLFLVQNGNIRRFSPLETERLMGLPDNYTNIKGGSRTKRYQATGNSWSVPVIKWIGKRILNFLNDKPYLNLGKLINGGLGYQFDNDTYYLPVGNKVLNVYEDVYINATYSPQNYKFGHLKDIVSSEAPKEIYISPVGAHGIIRRKNERNQNINPRLETILMEKSSEMSQDKIEKMSLKQRRGKHSIRVNPVKNKDEEDQVLSDQLSLF